MSQNNRFSQLSDSELKMLLASLRMREDYARKAARDYFEDGNSWFEEVAENEAMRQEIVQERDSRLL